MVNTLPRVQKFHGEYDPYDAVEAALGPTWVQMFRMIGMLPHRRQLEILTQLCPKMMLGGGEQVGKTQLAVMIMGMRYFTDYDDHPEIPGPERRYWICGHERKKFDAEWDGVTEMFKRLGFYHYYDKKNDVMYLKDGTRIQGILTANVLKIASFHPLGILLCEAGQASEMAYKRLMSRRVHTPGWIVISGTFEGAVNPWYNTEFQRWLAGLEPEARAFEMATWENSYLYPQGLDDPRVEELKRIAGERMFMERFSGKPQPAPGMVYPEFDAGFHVASLPPGTEHLPVSPLYNEHAQIHVWEDPGFDHVHAVLMAQYYGGVVWIFDEFYERGWRHPDTIRHLMMKPYWGSNPDKRVVSDPFYMRTHHANASVEENWREIAGLTVYGDRHRIEEGIQRVKEFLGVNMATKGPYIVIDGMRCPGLLSEMGVGTNPCLDQYAPYVYEVDSNEQRVGLTPKDANNDACDALRNGLVSLFGFGVTPGGAAGGVTSTVSTVESRGGAGYGPLQPDAVWYPQDRTFQRLL